jgi:hypothetical protein
VTSARAKIGELMMKLELAEYLIEKGRTGYRAGRDAISGTGMDSRYGPGHSDAARSTIVDPA